MSSPDTDITREETSKQSPNILDFSLLSMPRRGYACSARSVLRTCTDLTHYDRLIAIWTLFPGTTFYFQQLTWDGPALGAGCSCCFACYAGRAPPGSTCGGKLGTCADAANRIATQHILAPLCVECCPDGVHAEGSVFQAWHDCGVCTVPRAPKGENTSGCWSWSREGCRAL